MKAVILFGHGSRDPQWRAPMEAVAARAAALDPSLFVCCAYLELDRPDLATAAADAIARGARQLSVLPMFLGVGRHMREDLPTLVEQLREAHPGVTVELQPAVGESGAVIEFLARLAVSR